MKSIVQNSINHLFNQNDAKRVYSYTLIDKHLIHLNEHLDFNLFALDTPTHMSLFLQSDSIVDEQQQKRIQKIEYLYIRDKDKDNYDDFLENNLQSILKDNTIPLDEKVNIIYSSTAELTHSLYANPQRLENLQHSKAIVTPIIDTVLKNDKTIVSYMKIIEYDYYTHTHSLNVSIYAVCLGVELGLDKDTLKNLGQSALLHDLGKSSIDEKILNKETKLTEEEFSIMKLHPVYGYEIALKIGITDEDILDGIAHHHEKLNARGYPDALRDKEITLFPRIIAVCDIFDALTTHRSYKDSMTSYNALMIMKKEMKGHLDMKILETFIRMLHG